MHYGCGRTWIHRQTLTTSIFAPVESWDEPTSSTLSNFYETTTRGPLICPSHTHTHSSDEGKTVSDSRCAATDGMARFAGVELLALLSIVVGQRRVEVTDDPKYEFGTSNERKARVMDSVHLMLTSIPRKATWSSKGGRMRSPVSI